MPLRTPEQYVNDLKKQRKTVFIFGEKVKDYVDHPLIRPAVNSMRLTFTLAFSPKYEDLMTTKSNLTGEKINRFTQLHLTVEDYLKRIEQNYTLMKLHGSCVGGRCVGNDVMNALASTTYNIDQKLGTDYHRRFLDWLKEVQSKDLVVSGMITDVKGDRSKTPSEQPDPDAFLRVVEKREDGILIRGAKAHQSGAVIADYHLIGPTQVMEEKDKDYALACAVPADADGIVHVYEMPAGNVRRLFEDLDLDLGNAKYGVHGSSLVIFNDVFVPWERVFMCDETQFTRDYIVAFANNHRVVFASCHAAITELMAGAAALIAEYNGLDWYRVTHIREKIIDMLQWAALAKGCDVGAITYGSKTPSGVIGADTLFCNAAKLAANEATLKAGSLLADIAGGLLGTLPSERDLKNPDIGELLKKYLTGKADVPVENRMRLLRLCEYFIGQSSSMIPVTLHAGGSPETQKAFIRMIGRAKIEELKKNVKQLAEIKD